MSSKGGTMMPKLSGSILSLLIGVLVLPDAAAAAAAAEAPKPPRVLRVALGPELTPKYPGADGHRLSPLFDFAVKREGQEFAFEAADESFGPTVFSAGGFEFGLAADLQPRRKQKDVGFAVGNVGTTFELGAFAQRSLGEHARIRAEGRKGLGGHRGWVGSVSADFISRNADQYIFSIGPRLQFADARYQRAYFGVTPAQAAASTLPAYRLGGGLYAVGATSGLIFQLDKRWGVYSYAAYDRLIEDAADSPIVRRAGSRNQLSGGLGLTYTFTVK